MREFPTPWTVYLHRYTPGVTDAHGVPTKAWVPARGSEGIAIKVISWSNSGPTYEPEQNRSVERMELFVPPVLRGADGEPVADPGPMDVIDLPSGTGTVEYEVQGWPRDYTHGFHGWQAGKVIDLQRVEG
jgi:hypothetical protein